MTIMNMVGGGGTKISGKHFSFQSAATESGHCSWNDYTMPEPTQMTSNFGLVNQSLGVYNGRDYAELREPTSGSWKPIKRFNSPNFGNQTIGEYNDKYYLITIASNGTLFIQSETGEDIQITGAPTFAGGYPVYVARQPTGFVIGSRYNVIVVNMESRTVTDTYTTTNKIIGVGWDTVSGTVVYGTSSYTSPNYTFSLFRPGSTTLKITTKVAEPIMMCDGYYVAMTARNGTTVFIRVIDLNVWGAYEAVSAFRDKYGRILFARHSNIYQGKIDGVVYYIMRDGVTTFSHISSSIEYYDGYKCRFIGKSDARGNQWFEVEGNEANLYVTYE